MPRENIQKEMPEILRAIADGESVAEMPGAVYIEEELRNIADNIEHERFRDEVERYKEDFKGLTGS